ncbi:hypothetical protein Tco_0743209 [Tanacetum coccineum]
MSCLPNDIMESVISCETAKATWTNLVHSFKGPSDTKENRIMDLKLEYQTFRAKPSKSISRTYTRYKILLNELANDDVNLSKHEINVGFVNSLPEKWLTFSQGLRNANHTQTLNLVDINERYFEDYYFEDQYAVSIKEDTAYPCLHSPKTTKERRSICRIQKKSIRRIEDIVCEYSRRYQTWSLLQETPNTPYLIPWIRRIEPTFRPYKYKTQKLSNFNTRRNLVPESQVINESLKPTKGSTNLESSKDYEAESLTPLPPLKHLQGALPSLEVMQLTFQPYSPKERPGLGIMKHTKPKTQDSSTKSVSRTITVSETESTTPSIPIKVKNTEQETKMNELTKLV